MYQRNRSWLELIGYCMIAALGTALGLALLFAGASAAFASGEPPQASASAAQTSFTGMVTDERCGARHDRYPGKSASECARLCAVNGAKYVLLDGDTVYTLAGKDLALDKLAGQRATVLGTLEGTVITVRSVGRLVTNSQPNH
jgi:hypothetical protein